ncbi:hypothetical protein BH11ARM2_BH11ARM2_31710 [soil metagenome]
MDARFLWRAFVVLLLFEGALRKWVVPSLATPLLLGRDLVGLAMLAVARRDRVRFVTTILGWLMLFGGLCTAVSFFVCPSVPVTLYGWRTNFFYVPVVVALARMLDEEDVRWFARLLAFSIVPMTLLVALQALSKGTSFWNRGAGEGTGQIMLAGGFVRASGTFSFVTGLSVYYPAAVWALVYLRFDRREVSRLSLQVGAVFATLGVVLTGSRLLLVFIAFQLLVTGVSFVQLRPRSLPRLVRTVTVVALGLIFVAVLTPLGAAVGRFGERIATAEQTQSSSDRASVWLVGPFDAIAEAPLFGYGMGLGTSVGSALTTGKTGLIFNQPGSHTYYTEIEGARHVMEQGPILGLAYFLLRLAFLVISTFAARRIARAGLVSAWSLWAILAPQLYIGQMGQPTLLGFMVAEAVMLLVLSKERKP